MHTTQICLQKLRQKEVYDSSFSRCSALINYSPWILLYGSKYKFSEVNNDTMSVPCFTLKYFTALPEEKMNLNYEFALTTIKFYNSNQQTDLMVWISKSQIFAINMPSHSMTCCSAK